MNTGNQFGMGRNYFNMLNYDDSNGPKMNSFIDRNENRQINYLDLNNGTIELRNKNSIFYQKNLGYTS